jgi:hypothetical protein
VTYRLDVNRWPRLICALAVAGGLSIAPAASEEKVQCPDISVSAQAQPAEVPQVVFALQMPKQTITLTAPLSYDWYISAGEIILGQGTPSILVTAPAGETVTASIIINGFQPDCGRAISVSFIFP